MVTSKQTEIDFWKKKIKGYIKINEQLQIIKNGSLIPIGKIPKDITVSKNLSDKIKISISNTNNKENNFFCFSFYYDNNKIIGRFSNYSDTVKLFNNVYENFEKDNAEIQKKIKPIFLKEQEYLSIITAIKSFVTNMMDGTGYAWKLNEYSNLAVLQIKLCTPRIVEFEIHHKAFNNHPELFDKDKILNSLKQLNEAFENMFLPVNIVNDIYGILEKN